MKRLKSVIIALILVLSLSTPALAADQDSVFPTFSIVSVVTDSSVTIRTYNFPASDSFNVLMNYMGTRGVNGIKVATIHSGTGGSFTATFNIPAALKGQYKIAIRLQSNTGSGYYAYNWFYNNTAGGSGGPSTGTGYSGIPTFRILSVERDVSVTIKTNNFPNNDTFKVLMNYMGTRGVNGIKVDTISSGSGGAKKYTFAIPSALKGQYKIAIRLQSNTGSGYYAYNWFYNNTTGGSGGGGVPPAPGYSGYPTFSIKAVKRNQTVTIKTYNLPPNDKFKVLMGPMGTRGVNGIKVDTFDTGAGGKQTLTFNIPAQLAGSYKIAIRLQSVSGSGYYAYNWFYNNSTQ
jgi:hypothetical protein